MYLCYHHPRSCCEQNICLFVEAGPGDTCVASCMLRSTEGCSCGSWNPVVGFLENHFTANFVFVVTWFILRERPSVVRLVLLLPNGSWTFILRLLFGSAGLGFVHAIRHRQMSRQQRRRAAAAAHYSQNVKSIYYLGSMTKHIRHIHTHTLFFVALCCLPGKCSQIKRGSSCRINHDLLLMSI